MSFGDGDLAVFFQDGTTVKTSTGATFLAHFDTPEEEDHFGMMRLGKQHDGAGEMAGRMEITYPTASATLAHGSQVSIKGVNYKVRATRKQDDGQITVATLTTV